MKKGYMRKLIYLLLVTVTLTSCEKLMMPKNANKKPTAVFEELWHAIDDGYSLLSYKKIRWDSVYTEFKPLVYDSMTDRQLFDTCAKMLARLADPQVVLDAGFTQTHYDDRYKYPANFNKALLDRNYLTQHEKTGPLIHTIIDSIGYVYYGSFDEDVTEADIDAVINRFREFQITKGTVIDIRGNKGGKLENVFTLLSKIDIPDELLNVTTLIYQVAYKNGPKHDQFTKLTDTWLKESDGDRFYGKVVVLTNRDNAGNAVLFASGAKAIQSVKTMGDTTLGYGGLTAGYELPNGWRVHFPNSILLTSDGTSMLPGVAPTHAEQLDPAAEAQGKDSILEAALKELKEE